MKLTQSCTQSGRRIQNNTMNTKQETEAAAVTATDTQQFYYDAEEDWSCLKWTVCAYLIGVLKFSIMFY